MTSFSQGYKMEYNIIVFTQLICVSWDNIENINFKLAENFKQARKQTYWYSDSKLKIQSAPEDKINKRWLT